MLKGVDVRLLEPGGVAAHGDVSHRVVAAAEVGVADVDRAAVAHVPVDLRDCVRRILDPVPADCHVLQAVVIRDADAVLPVGGAGHLPVVWPHVPGVGVLIAHENLAVDDVVALDHEVFRSGIVQIRAGEDETDQLVAEFAAREVEAVEVIGAGLSVALGGLAVDLA